MLKFFIGFASLVSLLFQAYDSYARNKWSRVGPTTYIAAARQSPTTIVVLAHGQIQITSDLGQTWKTKVIDDSLRFTGIAFADSLHGVIAESRRYVLRTTDGGESWLYYDLGEFCFPRSIAYPSKDSIFLTDIFGRIWRSTDAGNSWNKQSLGASMQLRIENTASSIFFLDARHGFVVGDSGLSVRTTDGGDTWNSLALEDTLGVRFLNSIHFYDEKYGVIAGFNYFYVTSDGGTTWISRPIASGQTVFFALMVSPTRFIGFGPTGSVYESDDFGATIVNSAIPASEFHGYFRHAVWLPEIGAIAVGEQGTICSYAMEKGWRMVTSCWTKDDGTLADSQSGKLLIVSAHWRSANVSSQSTDGGRLWTSATIPGQSFAGIHFYTSDSARIFHETNLSQSLMTTDGGRGWVTAGIAEPPPYTRRWSSGWIHFSAEGTGYSGNEDGILRSTDHGKTWQYSDFTPSGDISSPFSNYAVRNWYLSGRFFSINSKVAFATVTVVDSQYGNPFAVKYRSLLVRTSDAGESWKLVNAPRQSWITSLFFIDQDHGFLGCTDGVLFRTTNGGLSWDSLKLATSSVVSAIAMKGSFGVIGTGNVELFISTDGGASWLQDGPTLHDDGLGPFYITQIVFPDSNSVVAIGNREFFRREINESLNVERGKPVQGNPYMFISLYPNPSQSELTCKLHGTYSDKEAILSAVISDLLGRTVMDLTQDANRANNGQIAEFTIDVKGLTAGVYFLTYTLGSNSYTRRFIKYP